MTIPNGRSFLFGLAATLAAGIAFGQDASKSKTALEVKATGVKTLYVDDQAGSNQVSFSSQAPIEDFTGVCNKVRGQCTIDPQSVESFAGKFSIRVEDMKTGIDLRDTHMRSEDWLDATKYPEITIEIASVEGVKKTGLNTASLMLVGTCSIRGKTNPVRIPATMSYLDESPKTQQKVKGDLIRLRAEFRVNMSDYGVTGPKGSETVGLKVSDQIELKVAIYGSTQPPPKPLEADRPGTATQPNQPAPPRRP